MYRLIFVLLSVMIVSCSGESNEVATWDSVFFDDFNRADNDSGNFGHATPGTWNVWNSGGGSIALESLEVKSSGDDSGVELEPDAGAEYLQFTASNKVKIKIKFTTPDDVTTNFTEGNYIALLDGSRTCPVILVVSSYNVPDDRFILQLLDTSTSTQLAFSDNLGLTDSTDYLLEYTVEAGTYTGVISNASGIEIDRVSATDSDSSFEQPGFAISYNVSGHPFYIDDFRVSTK